ncbi:MAG: hypothetical protein HYU83_02770 [Chloroflexi bacterium]|nr:hypothetical protein [Chloroflexota bacterium]
MRFSAFCSVSEQLISRLIECPSKHWGVGKEPKLSTFSLTKEEEMMPVKIKIRGRQKPVAGEVYRVLIASQWQENFVDEKTGINCRCRDLMVVRLYVNTFTPNKCDGELRFNSFPIGSELLISPKPRFKEEFEGVKERGCLWIAAPGVNYRVSPTRSYDRVVFNGPVVVSIAGQEKRKPGAIAVMVNGGLVVYDRRSDRLSSFARAEHIRRTVGKRTFEFVNLRDISMGELESESPERVLTNDGFEAVEE